MDADEPPVSVLYTSHQRSESPRHLAMRDTRMEAKGYGGGDVSDSARSQVVICRGFGKRTCLVPQSAGRVLH